MPLRLVDIECPDCGVTEVYVSVAPGASNPDLASCKCGRAVPVRMSGKVREWRGVAKKDRV